MERSAGKVRGTDTLKGISTTGNPMLDPTTGQATSYAFTGDPVAETGWLDVDTGTDTLLFLSSGPFSIAPGTHKMLTELVSIEAAPSLSEALH